MPLAASSTGEARMTRAGLLVPPAVSTWAVAPTRSPVAADSGTRTVASTGARAVTRKSESPAFTRRCTRAIRAVTTPANGAVMRVRS